MRQQVGKRWRKDIIFSYTADKKMRDIEHKLQTACVKWMRLAHPREAGLLFAIPNGGARNAITGRRLKDEGVMAGVADLFLSLPGCAGHGLYIEMKTSSGRQSAEQRAFEERVRRAGFGYVVCRSFGQFTEAVEAHIGICKM